LSRRVALSAAVLLALACESLIGAEFDDVHRRQAAIDAGSDAPPCDPLTPPGPPSVQGTPGDVQLTNIIGTVDYGDDPPKAYLEIGYDLDGRCTNRGDPPECVPEAWSGGDPTDGSRGQDNGVGKLLAIQMELFGFAPTTSVEESAEIKKGKRAPFGLLRISGFSGFSEDEKVRVEWYSALRFDAGQGAPTPKLDGSDAWPVAAFVSGPGDGGSPEATVVVDDDAYVTHATLVARFPALRVPLANVWFDVIDVVLTAKLTPEPGGGYRTLTAGVVAGRTRIDELLRVVPYITQSLLGGELCTDNPNYLVAKRFICSAADIPFGASALPSGICDGISFGLHFEGTAVVLGPTINVPPLPASCEPSQDPANDSCAIPIPIPDL
jgi:hypothetical protein